MREWIFIDQTILDESELKKQFEKIPLNKEIQVKYFTEQSQNCQYVPGEKLVYTECGCIGDFIGFKTSRHKICIVLSIKEDVLDCTTGLRIQLKPYDKRIFILSIHSWRLHDKEAWDKEIEQKIKDLDKGF
jgi:hypothetical protein